MNPIQNSPNIELKFEPKWDYISSIRTFIQKFLILSSKNTSYEKVEKITIAASELLENAIKYSSKDASYIKLKIYCSDTFINLVVENTTVYEQAEQLLNFLLELEKYTPLDGYLAMMKKGKQVENKNSKLGLARIRYESKAKINAIYKGNTLIVSAVFDL